jgi:hypothetical protein
LPIHDTSRTTAYPTAAVLRRCSRTDRCCGRGV